MGRQGWTFPGQIWSTDDLPQRDRFAHWREVRAKNLYGVSVDLDKDQHLDFHGAISAARVGSATLVEMHASSYRVRRTDADVGRAPNDSLCIYQQLRGDCWFDTGRSGEFVIAAGAIATSHSDLPYATTPTTDGGFHLRLVKIPFVRCRPLLDRMGDLPARKLDAESGLAALLSTYFNAFMEQAPYLQGQAAEVAVQTLAQLTLVARGLAATGNETGREALRVARLQAARDMIERNLHTPLSAASVASRLKISPRQLHLLFEPTGMSFGRYLLTRRLDRACFLLAQFPHWSITRVALECGFEGLSTFYRTFRAANGMSPGDFRQISDERRP